MADTAKVDLLLAYILCAAGQQDRGQDEVGPIHIIKYAYLADLAFALSHGGETFTGIPWRFYHYGPWSSELFQRIQPVVANVGATERVLKSLYYDDSVRWTLKDDHYLSQIEEQLPISVTSTIRQAVREFGDDTTSLLHYVYGTRPMLMASPGEHLDFAGAVSGEFHHRESDFEPYGDQESAARPGTTERPPAEGQSEGRSKKAEKRRKQRLDDLRQRIQERRQRSGGAGDGGKGTPFTPPRYDDEFRQGQDWLDSLEGEPLGPTRGTIDVEQTVWKSPGRGAENVPD